MNKSEELEQLNESNKRTPTTALKIKDIHIYRGRNVISHRPVMKMTVDIGALDETPTKDIPGFNEKLLKAFPGLKKHTCGLGYAGGFLDRLTEGTYIGHVLEHTILDIQSTLGFEAKYGKTRLLQAPSLYDLAYEYENEVCAYEISIAAVFILNHFIAGEEADTEELLTYLREIKAETDLGPSTAAIVREAKLRGIPVTRIGYESLVRLGYGKYSKLVQATLTDATSCISADISTNKQFTKYLLHDHQIPVPYGKVVYTAQAAAVAADDIGLPVAVKPFNGNQGRGVQVGLKSEAEVKSAFTEAAQYSAGVIVEKHITGNDYRVLVIGGEVKAVAQRLPAAVVGDGRHTVKELVDLVNLDPSRGEDHEKSLTKIKLDAIALELLSKNNMTENDIPAPGKKIVLRENCNISTGGIAIDCTDRIHPDNIDAAVRAANAIGIDVAGIDIVTADIAKSIYETNGAVIEVNTAPGIRMHLYPSQGKARNVARDIVSLLFPPEEKTDLPIVSVTGTNGKTSTVRLINHVLTSAGKTVGMTSTSGSYIGRKCIYPGDNSGPNSAKVLLAEKSIDIAVFETARGGILREGLGYDLADVGVITNITEDHLGAGGIDTVEDMAHVKSLVVEAVKPGGHAVLNAEDGMTDAILKKIKTTPILFYKDKKSVKVNPVTMGKTIRVYTDGGILKINDLEKEMPVVAVNDVPITLNGSLDCNVDNCLAAVAALFALGVPVPIIRNGLKKFHENPGRFQILPVGRFSVMLDYAHNYAGYEEIMKFCKNCDYNNLVGVIGMPGDRGDDAIKEVGALAAKTFDRIFIKEDKDLRGRAPAVVANLLYEAISNSGDDPEKASIVLDEAEALREAMATAEDNDLIVVLYEAMEPLIDVMHEVLQPVCVS
ncbi:MAG: cyanophycin synthetase [Clostridiales bacterium]|nr:cyanophycin synthetase [Clostridiales bacterium]